MLSKNLRKGPVEFDCNLHAGKRIAYIGVTHRTRSMDELRAEVSNMRADLWDAVSAGRLSLPIDRVFELKDAEAAQAHMRTNAHFGKIVMVPQREGLIVQRSVPRR